VANQDAIIATRAFKLYYDDYDAANALPADTVLYTTDPTGFTNVGWTAGGLTFGVDQTRNEIRVDQEFFPVSNPLSDVTITMGAELAEITPANLLSATGLGTVASLAADAVTRGHDELVITSEFTESTRTWLARVLMPDNEAANIALWRGQATASVDMSITPDNPSTIGVEVTGLVDSAGSPAGRIATYRRVTPIDAA
jgi:hypothetical protein